MSEAKLMIVSALYAMNLVSMRNDAVSRTIANNEAMYSMIPPLKFNGSMGDVFQREKALEMDNLRNSLNYKVACAQEASLKKALDKRIKETFSIFG